MNDLYPKLLVFFQFGLIALMIFFSHGVLSSIPALTLFSLGLALGLWAIDHNKRGNFNIQPKLKEGCRLVTTGAYNYIRHPMYASVILMMLAIVLATPTLLEGVLFLSLVIVLLLKAKREESLWCRHDEAYLEYKLHTKLFIPLTMHLKIWQNTLLITEKHQLLTPELFIKTTSIPMWFTSLTEQTG